MPPARHGPSHLAVPIVAHAKGGGAYLLWVAVLAIPLHHGRRTVDPRPRYRPQLGLGRTWTILLCFALCACVLETLPEGDEAQEGLELGRTEQEMVTR